MLSSVVEFFSQFPPELATFLMSMIPVGELRLSLPMAILVYNFPIWKAFLISVFGNMIPMFVILLFAGKFHKWVEVKAGYWGKTWHDYLLRAQNKFSGDYAKYGLIGLMIFIGIPFPGTGAYTGAIAAFVFGIPFKKSWPYATAGIIISGIITTLLTVGIDKIF